MKFKMCKNMIERSVMFINDFESTLLKGEARQMSGKWKEANTQIIHEYHPNSCCFQFMCTFDSSRNLLKTFEGYDCVGNMITEMYKMSQECIKEMKKNTEMESSQKDKLYFENALRLAAVAKNILVAMK